MVEAYFDESGTDKQSNLMCIAGYVMKSDQARRLDSEWLDVLRKYDLPYFHMSSCAHGVGVFFKLSKKQRIEVETLMIGIIKRRVERGIVATISEEEYLRVVPPEVRIFSASAYSWWIKCALSGVSEWLKKHEIAEPVAYFLRAATGFRTRRTFI